MCRFSAWDFSRGTSRVLARRAQGLRTFTIGPDIWPAGPRQALQALRNRAQKIHSNRGGRPAQKPTLLRVKPFRTTHPPNNPKTTHIYFRPPNRRGRATDRPESRFVPLSHPFDGKTRKIRARRGVWTLIRRRIDTVRLAGPPRVHPNRHPRPSPRAQRRAWAERAVDESCDRWRRRSGPAAGVSREKNKLKMS